MLTLPARGRPRRPPSSRRPALEVLEARSLPAAPAPIPIPGGLSNDVVIVTADLLRAGPTSAAALATALPAAVLAPPSPVGAPLIDQSVLGFQGLLVFPGTGLQIRSAMGPGAITQSPGQFPGGAGPRSDGASAPAPQAGDVSSVSESDDAAWLDLQFEELALSGRLP